ncbi:MAG TPA: DMT family transporter [Candidatus Saccharimonadales bacterium]|nr:DMT family transporter [Candidatus Saccharimonadales bacterium]
MISNDRNKGIFALVYLPLQFAAMGIFARYLATNFTVLQQVYLRILAALILAIFIFGKRIDYKKLTTISKREWGVTTFRAIVNYLFAVSLFSASVLHAKLGTVSFINALPFVALLGVLFFKEKLNLSKTGLILLSLLGVALVASKNLGDLFSWGYGEILAFFGAAAFAVSYVTRRWHKGSLNNYEITTLMFAISFVTLLIVSLLMGEGLPLDGWSYKLLATVAIAGLLNVSGLQLVNYAFTKVDNILAGNLLMLEVVFGLLLGYIFYKEVYTLRELLGGVLIVFSAIGMNYITSTRKNETGQATVPGEQVI